ncbi:MAG: hypothetical protein ACRELV_03305 [Longimicrobiales bacterium]
MSEFRRIAGASLVPVAQVIFSLLFAAVGVIILPILAIVFAPVVLVIYLVRRGRSSASP